MAFPRGSLSLFILALGLSACGDKSSDDSSGATEGPGSSGASSTSTGGMPPTGSETGSGSSGVASTTGDATSGTDTGRTASSEGGDPTTDGVACALEDQACAAAEALGAFEDCGVVDPWDDLAPAWLAARDCALKAASEQRAFKLITWLQGFDSQVGQAYVGLTAESYMVTMFHFDSDPCGGGGCGPVVSQGFCQSLTAVAHCEVEPGGACLSCDGQSKAEQVCGPR